MPTESDNKAPTPLPSDHGDAAGGGDVAHDGEPSPSLSTQGPAADVSAFASTSPRAHSAVIHEPAAATELEHAPDNTPLVTEAPQPLLQNQPEELAATAHSEHVGVEPREICEPAVDAQRHAGDEVDDKTVASLTRMQAIARGRQTRRRVSQSHAAETHSAPNAHSQASGVHSLDTSGDAGTAVNEGEDAVAAMVAAAEEQADTHDHATDRSHTPPPGSLLQSASPGEHSTAPGVAQPGTIPTSPSPPRVPVLSEPAEPEDALLAPLPSSAASPGGHFAEDSLEGKDGEEAAHSSAAHDVNMLDDSLMQ
ncbi:hypothetical protein EON66_04735 [archaeon]|nr:MAG: hypothetical protein EON66_04735 [archaeon]